MIVLILKEKVRIGTEPRPDGILAVQVDYPPTGNLLTLIRFSSKTTTAPYSSSSAMEGKFVISRETCFSGLLWVPRLNNITEGFQFSQS